ncbi:IPT/TIG domain-containing protein [Virgisporangium aurantiacum]|uniref:IPT/TIG domain-containing protein n=1 Tax=Virgisporangium aurantiacum TaxID=175570 RepID=A0A8J3ZB62_9ACTN|nr:IPT/TIG domain-containing protein [Virgisporangium aurantiacum]GIJ58476.1 hypothetical protein Vau01_059920 [Virgisporangium aurantiacum]
MPRLDTLSPASGPGGAEVTLTGADFGARNAASAVRFRVPDEGAAPVPAEVLAWTADTVRVRVPPLASFGSGGPLDVAVHTDAGDSDPLTFVVEEEAPPVLSAVNPVRGLENDTVVLTGERLGRPTALSTVVFQAPGPTDVTAQVLSWTPTSVRVRVPSLESLGGAGSRSIAVRTPWGRSGAVGFLLGELPSISAVLPASPSPGTTITVEGRAFGPPAGGQLRLVAVFDTEDPNAPPVVTAPAILSWTDVEIHAALPDLRGLRTTGIRDVVITTEWGRNVPDQRSRILIESRASITTWTRVEPHARTADLQRGLDLGLQARVYDPLWMLGRQWQLLELRGEDAGTPVDVRVDGKVTPLSRWRPRDGQSEHVPVGVPLEALVERERVIPRTGDDDDRSFGDLRLSAEAGLHLLRLIGARLSDAKTRVYRRRFLDEYGLRAPSGLDARSRRFLNVMADRAPDGSEIFNDFQGALDSPPRLPQRPDIDLSDRSEVVAALRDWYDWCRELFSEPTQNGRAWDPKRMEYAFAAGAGGLVLDAPEHDGGHLDWYSFVRRAPGSSLGSAANGRGPVNFTRRAVPVPVSYPGMPVPRWWEMEDRRLDFGSVAAAPNELLKLVLVEFATVFGNDWFTAPLDGLPVGTLCEIATVTVTDAFGTTTTLTPFGDGAGTDWRMFELSRSDGVSDAGNALLLLDALPTTQESAPVEEVLVVRDELANMAWAIENTVESRTGRPLDRYQDEAERRTAAASTGPTGARRYVLQSPVPRNWIPLLPKFLRDNAGAVTQRLLARGAMRAGNTTIPPLGRLLEPGRPLDIFDEEVPPTGAKVSRLWTWGRAADGTTHLWRARRKGPGRGPGSSGLRFDDTPPA